MATLTIDLPDDVFSALRRSPDEFAQELRLAAAMLWYQRGRISMEKGAQIADLNLRDFLDALARERIDVFHVNIDELRRELDRG